MKLLIDDQQKEFFQEHGAIEFEELLTADQVTSLSDAMETILAKRLSCSKDKLARFSSEQLFLAGRDLWRDSPAIAGVVNHHRLGLIASEMLRVKPLRLGYDQGIVISSEGSSFSPFSEKTLDSISCIQGVLGGLLIRLDDGEALEVDPEESSPLARLVPSKAGNVIVFSSKKEVDWAELFGCVGGHFLLITYSKLRSCYVERMIDPHVHALKKLGYEYGDRLDNQRNPIVYR